MLNRSSAHVWPLLHCLVVFAAWSKKSSGQHQSHNGLESFPVEKVALRIVPGSTLKTDLKTFENGDWVQVHWTGVQNPAIDDMIALYAPADADARQTAPVKYIWAIQSPSHVASGSGSYRFRLVNMRKSVRFAFLRTGLDAPIVEAYSKKLEPKNVNEPLQVHLSLTGKEGEMLAQWATLQKGYAGVSWGFQSGKYHRSACSDVQTYSQADMCGAPANSTGWSDPGLLHNAVMDSLPPSTEVYYTVGDVEYGFSKEFSFKTPPPPGPTSSVRFLAIADLGQAEIDGSLEHTEMLASLNTTQRLLTEVDHHQLLLHNGDISYARGFGTIWDAYWDQMMPLTTRMPYMAIPGNHERDWPGSGDRFIPQDGVADSGGECGVAFERRVKMPLPGKDKFWYSFDFGPIHFLQYSTEHHFGPGSEQYEFIADDLKGVDRRKTPWLIVGGHRPFIVDSDFDKIPDGDLPVSAALQAAFEELFMEHAVDMTWHGHHHSYQRTCPLFKGQCVPPNPDGSQNAPVHLVIGHAGAGLSFNVKYSKPEVFEVVQVEHGYMRVEANGTRLSCMVISSVDGHIMDKFVLQRSLELRQSFTFPAFPEN